MSAQHTPGPTKQQMLALEGQGYTVCEAWLDGYYDGLHAIKRIGANVVEVYAGGADNGECSDKHYAPRVYVNDRCIADADTLERAARIADIRARMLAAASSKATGSAA